MSKYFYFAADCPLESASAGEQPFPPAIRITADPPKVEILGNREWYVIHSRESVWEHDSIHTTLTYMADADWDILSDEHGWQIIEYLRRHLEKTEEIEIWSLFLDMEEYTHKWYTIPVDEMVPEDLRILWDMKDTVGGFQDRQSVKPVPPTQHCLIVTREPYEWNSARMKNWRELYPVL